MNGKRTYVGSSVAKKDSAALLGGKPVYTDDIAPKDCLIVKVLRSPYAHAWIEEIDASKALALPGVTAVYTWKDVPQKRFTMAGQTYPEPSPYDRLLLDRRMRFVGDAAAIVAGESEAAVDRALRAIKIRYQELEAVLDFRSAKDHPVLVHPEDNWKSLCPVGADNRRNLCASGDDGNGDVDGILEGCAYKVEETYHVKANQQAMMETFRTFAVMDPYGRLTVTSSTQVPFHVRRILAHALDIPKSKVRVIKPRIGGGFGAKQTVVSEVYPAFVTWKTGKPAKMIYTRYESQIASSPRHEMEVHVRLGADQDGIFQAIEVYTLSNTGAFGEHGPTTVGLSGHKSIPLYSTPKAYRFHYDVVYTNTMSAGAYRGYGATQGIFAVESAVNELARKMNMDPVLLREKNMVHEGDVMPAYYGETARSCALDRCMARAKELMGWNDKFPCRDMGNGRVRSVGVAMSMQGSAISKCDVAGVTLKLNDDGFYTMMIGAADMGTGCDTTLAQIAADCLGCDLENIVPHGVDTDVSPYDSGSYASSTAYLTGMATVKACEAMVKRIKEKGAEYLGLPAGDVDFDGEAVYQTDGPGCISLKDIGNKVMCNNEQAIEVTESHSSPVSPPPFMVGMAEIEMDKETCAYELVRYVAVVDCGTPINPALVRVQTEGGLGQGIGMAMFEDVTRSRGGRVYENSFMQ
ncbi:MAG: xanthine dehydrogenase family protein molybdopterin-binding subunit, partial [Eubacteriales bacterium]|nr:xanthine dehydrogenase family protein molybdopterin-binding subunit [Eubacteriales bacterium]